MPPTVAVIPAGQWGTALAMAAARRGCAVRLWLRNTADQASFADNRQVQRLPGITLPAAITATSHPADALSGADLVLFAAPSRYLRGLCRSLREHIQRQMTLVSLTKGLEIDTGLRMSQVISDELPQAAGRVAVVSGPNFALEVARELPVGTVVASADRQVAEYVQEALMTPRLRVYTNADVTGVELAGALKNVIAIAAGISDGLGLGLSARATVITRGIAELARLGEALGADTKTFSGLAGLGDLVLTCTGDLSRNRSLGLAIGRGQSPDDYLAQNGGTIEGMPTAAAAVKLAQTVGVELPIIEQVAQVLFAAARPEVSLEALMKRDPTDEVGR